MDATVSIITNSRALLQQRVTDYRRGLLLEAQIELVECFVECLCDIDEALFGCEELTTGAVDPAPVIRAKETLQHRIINACKEDRRVNDSRRDRRARPHRPTSDVISEPVRQPAWDGSRDTLVVKRR